MLGAYWLFVAAAIVASPSYASPHPDRGPVAGHVIHERRTPSNRWIRSKRVDASAILPVRIGLKQSNLDKGHDLLMELSHPESPKYGQWWTTDQVHDFFAPADETVDLVRAWIVSTGIANSRIVHHDNKGWLAVDVTVEEAELLLKTTFYEYQHSSEDKLSVGVDSYQIPENLVGHVDYVTPGAKMVSIRKRDITPERRARRHENAKRAANALRSMPLAVQRDPKVSSRSPSDFAGQDDVSPIVPDTAGLPKLDASLVNCTSDMTINCLRVLYKFPICPEAVPGHELGVFEQNDFFDKDDLDLYFADYASWVPKGTYPVPALIDGALYGFDHYNESFENGEALADLSFATAMIYPQKVVLYSVDDVLYLRDPTTLSFFNTFLDALDGSYCTYSAYGETGNDPKYDPVYPNPNPGGYKGELMCGVFKPTKVISTSWSYYEYDVPWYYQRRQCDEYMKLSLMGTTIVSASGDNGLTGPDYTGHCQGPDQNIFTTASPNNCAYVLVVGGTMLDENQTIFDEPRVLNVPLVGDNYTSSGGFSNIQLRPDYQKEAVQHYLDNYGPSYPYYEQLEPDFAKVQGLYNRIGRAYPDVSGHALRYALYQSGQRTKFSGVSAAAPVWASILTLLNQERALAGKSSIGFVHPVLYSHPEVFNDIVEGNNLGCGTDGFKAAPGWDLPSGLGTPNYPKMRELFLSLP